MKKVLLIGTFVLSAISFANTETKAEVAETNNIKVETTETVNKNDSQTEDWWTADRLIYRGSDRK
ncbi:MAG: hypothetical protein ACRCU6_04680 [Fusobacteriaceae bacterium]